MQVRYYTDENIDHAVCKGLLLRNIDVRTCQEEGMMGATDDDQLAHATQLNRVLFTHDEDFFAIHASGISHAGIVFSNQRKSIGEMVRGLMLIHEVLNAEDMINHLETI